MSGAARTAGGAPLQAADTKKSQLRGKKGVTPGSAIEKNPADLQLYFAIPRLLTPNPKPSITQKNDPGLGFGQWVTGVGLS